MICIILAIVWRCRRNQEGNIFFTFYFFVSCPHPYLLLIFFFFLTKTKPKQQQKNRENAKRGESGPLTSRRSKDPGRKSLHHARQSGNTHNRLLHFILIYFFFFSFFLILNHSPPPTRTKTNTRKTYFERKK